MCGRRSRPLPGSPSAHCDRKRRRPDLWPNGADGRRVLWPKFAAGRPYGEKDVAQLGLYRRVGFFRSECDRADEIIASWDNWQAEQKAAQERECVAEAKAVWGQEVEDYHAMGVRVAKLRATTMAGVIAKEMLLAERHELASTLLTPRRRGEIAACDRLLERLARLMESLH
jgi:hypothetical protein